MLQAPTCNQCIRLHQRIDDELVGATLLTLLSDDFATFEARSIRCKLAVGANCEWDPCIDTAVAQLGATFHPGVKVFATMTRCSMDEASTRFVSNMITGE